MTDWTNARLVHDAQVVFHVLSGRWTLPVLAALEPGPRRHNELRRAIQPVHPKVLNETLHRLTAQQLLRREVRAGTPPAVYYALSDPARSLMQELESLLAWANDTPSLLQHWRGHAQRTRL
jgi:DNA-binding HxlR family transcriptional regulator